MKFHETKNGKKIKPFCQTRVMCRYSLYERKDLSSRIIWSGTNKAEMKKLRTGWKYQILLTSVTAEIYDNVKKEWVA